MPHLILEYSANVRATSGRETAELGPLFARLHRVLSETAGIDIQNCKSRVRVADEYLISDGGALEAFVHLDIRFLEGRSADIKKEVGIGTLDALKEWFAESSSELALQITVEVQDIDRQNYFKHSEGTPSHLPNTTPVPGKTAPD